MQAQSLSCQPLAARMRPTSIEEFVGQKHLLARGKPLRQTIENRVLHSMILWGPPGTGKTTLAKLLASSVNVHMESISAVLAGVKEIREVVSRAKELLEDQNKSTILFVDEVHRFNKAQQDAFLPFVEDGTLTLIGATTENPSFELNNALLSRSRVYVLKRLDNEDIVLIIKHALIDCERGLGRYNIKCSDEICSKIAIMADGDARQALNLLEMCADFVDSKNGQTSSQITDELLIEVFGGGIRRFDKGGEFFYDQISALHKAVRGSVPDAALYWFCRMVDGGCDPLYLARRIIRMATEDIGNADPKALSLAVDASRTYERLGSPEGELALAQAVIYLAIAPKSNACYVAYNEAMEDARKYGSLEVPLHIRNAPTKLMKDLGCAKNYRYAHDEEGGYAPGENYLPENLSKRNYYRPVPRGLEIRIGEKLEHLKKLDEDFKK